MYDYSLIIELVRQIKILTNDNNITFKLDIGLSKINDKDSWLVEIKGKDFEFTSFGTIDGIYIELNKFYIGLKEINSIKEINGKKYKLVQID